MRVRIVRHTAVGIEKSICYGQSDVPLAPTWQADIAAVAERVSYAGEAIFSSPLTRCETLARHISPTVKCDDRLREIDMGDWELAPYSEIGEAAFNAWLSHLGSAKPPRGESYADVQNRIFSFWDAEIEPLNSDTIIVAHDGAIRVILARICRMPLDAITQFKIEYGAIIALEKGRFGWQLHVT